MRPGVGGACREERKPAAVRADAWQQRKAALNCYMNTSMQSSQTAQHHLKCTMKPSGRLAPMHSISLRPCCFMAGAAMPANPTVFSIYSKLEPQGADY